MNFLLIPKNGKPRFHCGNPFAFIHKNKKNPIFDYFKTMGDLDLSKNELLGYCYGISDVDETPFVMTFFNEDGVSLNRGDTTINEIATSLVKAYGINMTVYDDTVVYKLGNGVNDFEEMTNEDKKLLKRMINDAIKWF